LSRLSRFSLVGGFCAAASVSFFARYSAPHCSRSWSQRLFLFGTGGLAFLCCFESIALALIVDQFDYRQLGVVARAAAEFEYPV
jgi:hypothetical protein